MNGVERNSYQGSHKERHCSGGDPGDGRNRFLAGMQWSPGHCWSLDTGHIGDHLGHLMSEKFCCSGMCSCSDYTGIMSLHCV